MHTLKSLTGLLTIVAFSGVANAMPITFGFAGNASGSGLPGGDCGPVTCEKKYADILFAPFSGRITFDTNTIDENPGDPTSGLYTHDGDPYGISFAIGDFFGQSNGVNIAVVPEPFTSEPQYHFFADNLGGMFTRIGLINCYEGFSGIITSDSLLTTPPPVGNNCFDPAYITTHDGFDLALDVTQYYLVPEPGVLVLFGIGLFGIGISTLTRSSAKL